MAIPEAKQECPEGYPKDVEHAPFGLACAKYLFKIAHIICPYIRLKNIKTSLEVFLVKAYITRATKTKTGKKEIRTQNISRKISESWPVSKIWILGHDSIDRRKGEQVLQCSPRIGEMGLIMKTIEFKLDKLL